MNILHFSTADRDGGSGRSAWRIHDGLRQRGHTSRMLCQYTITNDTDTHTVSGSRLGERFDRAANSVTAKLGLQYTLVPSTGRVRSHKWVEQADIIQLFNVHGGYFDLANLPHFSRRVPIVWRFSDMWPATGHCAYSSDCARWTIGCGSCPDLQTYPSVGKDFTAFLWRRKKRLYAQSRLSVVAPSSWAADIAAKSPLFDGVDVHRIPNGADREIFRPIDQATARTALGLPHDRKIILFSAQYAFDNPRKGTALLETALQAMQANDDVTLAVVGHDAEKWVGRVPQNIVPFGFVQDDRMLAIIYAACDMLVVPSASENLPNCIIEGFACGRAAVAFDAGGIRDAIKDNETGLLVPESDTAALAKALDGVLGNDVMRERLNDNALSFAQREFCAKVEATRFERLYETLLDSAPNTAERAN
ncbi:MAG: glycosyltransferase family 4 protein [Pseudomonadota bacterium]